MKERGAGILIHSLQIPQYSAIITPAKRNNEKFNQKMEQHQPDQTYHLRPNHRTDPWSCCSSGIRNLNPWNHVRRSIKRYRPTSGILPGYECTLSHEVRSEDQFKIHHHPVHGR